MCARQAHLTLPACLALAAGAAACLPPAPARAAPLPPERLHALLLNGGGSAKENYASHLEHLRQAVTLLLRARVPRSQIAVFSADGDDPTPDLATRPRSAPEGAWLLRGTALGGALDPGLEIVDSRLPGFTLLPARRSTLRAWFDRAGRRLRAGDTLLLFVTDHGTNPTAHRRARPRQAPRERAAPPHAPAPADPRQSRIQLWGEDLAVAELQRLLARLPAGVRTVAVMSQCYSGGFGLLYEVRARGGLPGGAACGYFSTTADRTAWGCYPESLGEGSVGHAFHFLRALDQRGSAGLAHLDVLVRDDSPDIPLRSSDLFHEHLLERAARRLQRPGDRVAADLLQEALANRAPWEHELRLIDRIASQSGVPSARSFEELERLGAQLDELLEALDGQLESWEATRADMAGANLERFLATQPAWQARLRPQAVQRLSPASRIELADEFLGQLQPFSAASSAGLSRLQEIDQRVSEVESIQYRLQVRAAALLRMRYRLLGIAARFYLDRLALPEERSADRALQSCEDLELPLLPSHEPAPPSPLVPLAADLDRTQALLPGYLGIQFEPAPAALHRRTGLPAGASLVRAVLPGSPAAQAGLRPGDVVVGAGDEPLTERNQIRAFTMLSPVGRPTSLRVLRDGVERSVEVTIGPFPRQWPRPPAPPRVSDPAPAPSGLQRYRGREPGALTSGRHLLFFWATWCAPCKAALPELLRIARDEELPVLAITDEPREELDRFFAGFPSPFVADVAIDEQRATFLSYGVNATPTFVLVGADGRIDGLRVGYSPAQGLRFR